VVITAPAAIPAGARPAQRRRPGEFGAGRKFTPRRKVCQFCVDKIKEVDYKDLGRLRRFLSERGKIEPRRKTGTCAAHQRSLNVALKRARQLALLPFTAEHIRVTGVVVREPGAPPFRGARGPRPGEVEGTEAVAETPAPEPEPTTDGQAPAPSTDSPEMVASAPSAQGARETPATGPSAQEA
jgi:small subunit ribosomal protein S18